MMHLQRMERVVMRHDIVHASIHFGISGLLSMIAFGRHSVVNRRLLSYWYIASIYPYAFGLAVTWTICMTAWLNRALIL